MWQINNKTNTPPNTQHERENVPPTEQAILLVHAIIAPNDMRVKSDRAES
jgi:hypothetical protein